MKSGNWIPVDRRLINLMPRDREYTFVEAYISYRCDIENGAENSINGYSRMWSWSRNKVRHFVEGLRTGEGHTVDNQRTGKGQEIRLIFNNLQDAKDSQGTVKGQAKDSQGTTTIIKEKKDKKDKVIDPVIFEILAATNTILGTHFKGSKDAIKNIAARIAEGACLADFESVCRNMNSHWGNDPKMSQYLCPETLFGNKFDKYLNTRMATPQAQRGIDTRQGYVLGRDPVPEVGTPEYKEHCQQKAEKYN